MSDYPSSPKDIERLNEMISIGKHLVNKYKFDQLDFLVTRTEVKFKLSVIDKVTKEVEASLYIHGFKTGFTLN